MTKMKVVRSVKAIGNTKRGCELDVDNFCKFLLVGFLIVIALMCSILIIFVCYFLQYSLLSLSLSSLISIENTKTF